MSDPRPSASDLLGIAPDFARITVDGDPDDPRTRLLLAGIEAAEGSGYYVTRGHITESDVARIIEAALFVVAAEVDLLESDMQTSSANAALFEVAALIRSWAVPLPDPKDGNE